MYIPLLQDYFGLVLNARIPNMCKILSKSSSSKSPAPHNALTFLCSWLWVLKSPQQDFLPFSSAHTLNIVFLNPTFECGGVKLPLNYFRRCQLKLMSRVFVFLAMNTACGITGMKHFIWSINGIKAKEAAPSYCLSDSCSYEFSLPLECFLYHSNEDSLHAHNKSGKFPFFNRLTSVNYIQTFPANASKKKKCKQTTNFQMSPEFITCRNGIH